MSKCFKRLISTFKPGDVLILRSPLRGDRYWLTKPLEIDGQTHVGKGFVNHNDLFKLKSRSIIKTTDEKTQLIALNASTDEYISLSQRDAAPIYSYDAAAMVTMADLHFDYPELNEDNSLKESPIQILEAGTGHGSLTLSICSKLHVRNCYLKKFGVRGGILHSIDNFPKHSKRGQKTIENFKRGLYKDDVEFHIAESPTDWLQNHSDHWKSLEKHDQSISKDDKEGFLSAAFLDMPDPKLHLKQISKNLKQDAPLIVYCPSVTQIIQILDEIRINKESIKLTHTRTIQLTPGIGGGLQDWDVRYTFIRATNQEGLVCRPKVGSRVIGGAFIAIFNKLPNDIRRKPTGTTT